MYIFLYIKYYVFMFMYIVVEQIQCHVHIDQERNTLIMEKLKHDEPNNISTYMLLYTPKAK